MRMSKKLVAILVALTVLVSTLCGINFSASAATVAELIESKAVLAPGTYDDLSTDDYNLRFIRSEAGYEEYKTVDDYFTVGENTIDYADPNVFMMTQAYGKMFGIPHKKVYMAPDTAHSAAGQSLIYKVQGGTYVATALIGSWTNISNSEKQQIYKSFGFDYSVDGNTWYPLDTEFVGEHVWTATFHQLCCTRAVSHLPENAKYYRVTMAGYNKSLASQNSTDPTLAGPYNVPCENDFKFGKRVGIGPSCASNYNLADYKLWEDVPSEEGYEELIKFWEQMENKEYLDAGMVDYLSDDSYAYMMLRSKNLPDSTLTEAQHFANVTVPAELSSMTQPFGAVMRDLINTNMLTHADVDKAWGGSSVIYKVTPGNYVATSLMLHPDYGNKAALTELFKTTFAIETSTDGWTWIPSAVTYSNVTDSATNNAVAFANAISQIPEKANYYRVTLASYDPAKAGNILVVDDMSGGTNPLGSNLTDSVSGIKNAGIGLTVASSYNLASYRRYNLVPAETADKTALEEMAFRASVVNDVTLADGSYKDAFIAARTRANELLETATVSQGAIDRAVANLKSAYLNLRYKDYFDELPTSLTGVENQENDRRYLKPGIYNDLSVSPYFISEGEPKISNGLGSIIYTNDYATIGVWSKSDGTDANRDYYCTFSRTDYNLSALNFMGKPIKSSLLTGISWAATYLQYRVYSGSYVSQAFMVTTNRVGVNCDLTDMEYKVAFMVSKDGKTYEKVEPLEVKMVDQCDSSDGITPYAYSLYKITAKIPEGYTYLRVVSPGYQEISEETKWYLENPTGGECLLGGAMASMYDLTNYDSYKDVPDYTPVYNDPEIIKTDTQKVKVSSGIFGIMKPGMTVAEAEASVTLVNGTMKFFKADGTPAADTDTVVSGMIVRLYDPTGADYFANILSDPLFVVQYDHVYKFDNAPKSIVANMSEKTKEGLKLPDTVIAYTGDKEYKVEVIWDVANANYNPRVTQRQEFDVKGKVILPTNLKNPLNISLTVYAPVMVYEPVNQSIRTKEGVTDIVVDKKLGAVYVPDGMTALELYNRLEPFGDTKFQITMLDENLGKSVAVPNDSLITPLMGVDISYVKADTLFLYYTIMPMSALNKSDFGTIDSLIPATGETLPIVAIVVLASAAAVVFVFLFAKRKKEQQ